MASGQYNTMAEYLNKCAQDITSALQCPDADIPFLTDLLTQMIGKLREGTDQQAANPNIPGINQGPGLPGAGPMPPPPGMGPGGPSGPSMPTPPGGGGIPMGGGQPPQIPGLAQQSSVNPDELRRLVGG